jgi:predicted lipoprotein with Yx(FWY)xxD motif
MLVSTPHSDGCADFRIELGVYVLGTITPADRARVVGHLVSCEECRDEVAGLAAVPALLRKLPADTAARLTGDGVPFLEPDAISTLPGTTISRIVRYRRRHQWLTAAAVAVLAAAAGAAWAWRVSPPRQRPAVAGTVLQTRRIGSVTVLTDSRGFTLYWFAPDTATKSVCNGSCAWRWPPVIGPAAASTGVTGRLGVITRADGSCQVTYNGHPLYTASTDSAPGMTKGNNLTASGGRWHEVVVSGSAPAPSGSVPSASASDNDDDGY